MYEEFALRIGVTLNKLEVNCGEEIALRALYTYIEFTIGSLGYLIPGYNFK